MFPMQNTLTSHDTAFDNRQTGCLGRVALCRTSAGGHVSRISCRITLGASRVAPGVR
jgi:hypothetical protein